MQTPSEITCRTDQLLRLLAVTIVIFLATATAANAALEGAGPTETTVTLTWTAPGDDDNSGQATAYDLRYALVPITDQNWNQAVSIGGLSAPQPAGSAEEFTVTGLDPNTTYYFAIKTADEIPNWSPLSNVVAQTTLPESTAPANIADLSISDPTPNSLTLNWTAPGDDGNTGTASQYEIRYSTVPITDQNWSSATLLDNVPAPQTAGSSESIVVSGLETSTTYYFAIRTADEVPNWSGLSNVANGSTANDQTAPAAIDDLQASTGTTQGTLSLNWTAPLTDTPPFRAVAYEIRYSKTMLDETNFNTGELWTSPPTPAAGGFSESTSLSHLDPGEMYYVGIRSYDAANSPSAVSNIDSGVAKLDLILDVDDPFASLPENFSLSQNFPNPFNPTTTIRYSVAEKTHVRLLVYNLNGQTTKTIVDDVKLPGVYEVEWNGTDADGLQVASGIYFYNLMAGDYVESRKMVLLK